MSGGGTRRAFLALAGASVLTACGSPRRAARCSGLGRRVRFIVPYPLGGGYDLLARLLEPWLEAALGVEVAIENEPGGGGLVGATRLRDALPDGSTLGMLGAPGLIAASVISAVPQPHPVRDFEIVGRLNRRVHALCTSATSDLRDMPSLFARARERPVVVGLSGLGSPGVFLTAVLESLLDLPLTVIAGYAGAREEVLALLRGEVDLIDAAQDALQDVVRAGDLRVLLNIADERSEDPLFASADWLGGEDGWAARQAAARGRSRDQAMQDAADLAAVIGAGTVVVAPRGVPAEVLACLRERFLAAARSPEFTTRARAAARAVDVAGGDAARAALVAAESAFTRFAPLARSIVERVQ